MERGRYKIFNESVEVSKEKSPFAYSIGVPLYSMLTESGKKLVFSKSDIEEEIPANAVGPGNIAGIVPGEDPPDSNQEEKEENL